MYIAHEVSAVEEFWRYLDSILETFVAADEGFNLGDRLIDIPCSRHGFERQSLMELLTDNLYGLASFPFLNPGPPLPKKSSASQSLVG
jgi:hypothetical protein